MKILNSFFLRNQFKNPLIKNFIKCKSSKLVEVIKSQVKDKLYIKTSNYKY